MNYNYIGGKYMEFSYKGVALIPIITFLVDVLKSLGLKPRYAPFACLVLGILLGMLFLECRDIKENILQGILMGTSATGLYSNGRRASNTMKDMKNKRENKNKE